MVELGGGGHHNKQDIRGGSGWALTLLELSFEVGITKHAVIANRDKDKKNYPALPLNLFLHL